VVFAVERAAGVAGVELLQILLVVGAFTLAVDTARRRAGGLPLATTLPLLAVALSASRPRFVPRPHLVTFLFLALLMNLAERRVRRLPLWFALIGVVWGNAHAGTVFGLAVVAAMAAASWAGERGAGLRRTLPAAGAFLAGTLANPNGLYPYLYSFGHLGIDDVVQLSEFRSAGLRFELTFFVFAAVVAAAVALRLRRRDWLFALLAAGFFPLACGAIRIIPKFVIVTLPGVLVAAAELWERRRGAPRAAHAAAAAALAAAALFLTLRDARNGAMLYPFGVGLNARQVPQAAAEFIRERGLEGPMYNDLGQGGYLAWRLFPPRRILVDGRVQTYPPELFRELAEAQAGPMAWQAFLDRRGIAFAVAQRRAVGDLRDKGVLFEAVRWPLVFVDGISSVYVRPGSEAERRCADARFTLVSSAADANALSALGGRFPAAMGRELARIDAERLLVASDFTRFGAAALAAGGATLAERFSRAGLRLHPRDEWLRLNLGLALAREGRDEDAAGELRRVARGRGAAAEQARSLLADGVGASR
jgi:hypothetical protein